MGLMGSIFGGAIGFALGGLFGAILGGAIGHGMGGRGGAGPGVFGGARANSQQQAQAAFFVATFSMLAKMAKADGHVSEEEIALTRRFMRERLKLGPQEEAYAIEIFRVAKDSDVPFEEFAEQFQSMFGHEPRMKVLLLELLSELAQADGRVHPREEEMLRQAATIFGLRGRESDRVFRTREVYQQDYITLGVSPDASMTEIKQSYRKLVVEYHPDKVQARGMPEEFVEFSEQKFVEIQTAYDRICKTREAQA